MACLPRRKDRSMEHEKVKKRSNGVKAVTGLTCLLMLGFVTVWAGIRTFQGFKSSGSEDSSAAAAVTTTVPPAEAAVSSTEAPAVTTAPEATQPAPITPQTPEMKFPTSDEIDDDFSDAVFIGNSRTLGLKMNCGKPLATFLASTGLNVQKIWEAKDMTLSNGDSGTVFDALKEKQYKRVFLMFGINEIGWPYLPVFQEMYEQVIKEVRKLQPNAVIYVQSVLPVSSKALSINAVYTTENIDALNSEHIYNAAKNTGTIYLDVNSALRDVTGALPEEASTDGIHLVKKYYLVWLDYLAKNT